MERKQFKLNDIEAYTTSFRLSNFVWDIVALWSDFERDTVGEQYVRAIDSISANLAEGFGRYGKKDKNKFYRYARASVYECYDWNEKSKVRKLISNEQYEQILRQLQSLPKLINGLIKLTNDNLKA